jgi:AraC family transcriptional regulator
MRDRAVPPREEPLFQGDMTLVRAMHGVEAVRRVSRFSNNVAIGAGRVESRLKRAQAPADGPFMMNFAPPGAEVWGYSEGIRRVRDIRLDFELSDVSEALGETLAMPPPRVFRNERLRYLARCLAEECEKPDEYSSLYVDSLTLAACIDFLRLGRDGSADRAGRLAPGQLRRVQEYLIEHLAETVRLKELAAITGLSQSQFGRAFKASTGFSPHRWQLTARVGKAQELLLAGQMPLAEIALATGFVEQSHFNRVFRNIVGTPPGSWRREHRSRRADAEPNEKGEEECRQTYPTRVGKSS